MVVSEDDALVEWCTVERVMACCRRQVQRGGREGAKFFFLWQREEGEADVFLERFFFIEKPEVC